MSLADRRDPSSAVVLHVVSYDVSRGAERYARALVDAMNSPEHDRHVLMTMFRGDEDSLRPDYELGVSRGALRRFGFDPRVVTRMRRVLRSTDVKAIVAHGGEPAKYVALAAGDVPYAYLVIGSSHPLLSNPIRRLTRDFYVKRASALVAVSSHLADELSELTGAKVHVIPNGRDPEVYRPADPANSIPRIIFVGHLDEQKRPLRFVALMRELERRGVAASGLVVGGGPLREQVTAEAAGLEIEVLGPRDDVPELLAASDLLVLTSRPPEGMPGVLIEAGLAGLPVVTTDVPGARDVVAEGETGFVVGLDDEDGLTSAVIAVLSDAAARERMGRAARARCVAGFSLEATAGAWEGVIEEMAS